MDSDDNSDKTPEMYHNSNSEDPSDGSIISYLQFQRPETPPEYRGQDEKDNPSIETVSFIADNENPMKAEQNTEASSELPSSSPCQKECYDHGDEMETQQSSEDFPQTDYDTMPEAQQLSKASMAEMILGDNTSELQDSNLENSTVLQHTKNATDLQTSTGAYPTDLHVQAEGDSQDLAEGEKSTEIQALSEDNSSDLGHTNKENTPELEIDSDKNITSQKVLQNISNEEVPEFKPPMGDNSTLKHSSAEITAENIVEVQHPREESSRELEYPREYEIAEQPNKENMTELEQCDENISKLTHPREETQESFITETPELENSNANISELTHPKEESFITETPELEQCNEKISELTHPREESIITETSGLEQCNEKISELTHPREETQESIITETPELELCNANISELTHPREESIITETRYPSGESESGMQSPREEKINELECFSEDKTIELQLPKVETIAKLETEEDELMGPDQLSELEKPAEENSSGIRVDIGDNNTELQPLSDMNRSVAVGDTEVECQLNENVKSELEQSREDNEMDTQPRDCEDKSVSIISDKVVEVSNGDELGSTLQPIQHGISHVHEKPELDKSELEQPTAEKPLAERETVAITLAGETNESDTCKLPTLSPKLEPQEIQLVDEAKVQEKQSNAAPVEPESKLDHLVIPAPEIAPSVVMQEHMSNEEYRSWKEVLESPEDFEAWVKLLALAEKHENPVVIRETFDRFLKLYPYCYGYWRKFADLVLRLQGWPHAQQILEIGVYSIPLSIDLWLHYAALSYNQGIDYTAVTALYDRSLEIAGYEYRSDLLWEAAIHYQESQNQMLKVFALLRQLIATPTQQYKKHFHKYETFLNTRSICELLSEEEFKTIGEQTKYTRLANESGKSLDEKVRDCLLDQGRQVHAATEEEIGLRQSFEEKIKRPYFHVQPLEETQLQTWRSYLDFEIARKYKDRIVFLFERCMIVCALYEEMWIKYAKFLGSEYSEETRAVFQRGACYIPKSVAIHLEWSLFEESLGQLDRARELLHTIDQKIPDLIETRLRFIAFELRHGNKGKVDELYKQSVSQSQKQFQKNSSHSQDSKLLHDVYNYWVTKYVFFLQRHRNEHAVAKKMLFDAIEKDKNNSTLYFYLVDLELNQQPLDKDKVMSVLNKAIHAPLEQEVKEAFCIRKLNWAEEMGIPLDYRVMNELKTLRDKSTATPSPSAHALRKRPNEYESDLYTKHSRVDSSTFPSEQNQQNMNYQQSRDPDQQQYPPYYQGYQGGEMGESNQQWSQQYNYQQDWGYQHQYHNQ